MEEKKFNEEVIDCIKKVCESKKWDVDFNEFEIDVEFNIVTHRVAGCIYLENEWDLTYRTTLTEKDGNFHHSIYSSINPRYIAAYAVYGYKKTRDEYKEEQLKVEEEKRTKETKEKSLFDKLFRR